MYSWELDQFIKDRSNTLTVSEYFEVTDFTKNPQLARVKYNAYEDDFQIITNDGFSWIVRLKKYEGIKDGE